MYCVKCRTKREGKDAQAVTMNNGGPAYKASCEVCGTTMFKLGDMPLELKTKKLKGVMWAVEKSGGYWYFNSKKEAIKYGQTISWDRDNFEIKVLKIKILKTYQLRSVKEYKLKEIK